MEWSKISNAEKQSLLSQGVPVQIGIPCPWCNQLIENPWTKHVFVAKGIKGWKAGKPININPPLTGLYCNCPHCNSDFEMKPGTSK